VEPYGEALERVGVGCLDEAPVWQGGQKSFPVVRNMDFRFASRDLPCSKEDLARDDPWKTTHAPSERFFGRPRTFDGGSPYASEKSLLKRLTSEKPHAMAACVTVITAFGSKSKARA